MVARGLQIVSLCVALVAAGLLATAGASAAPITLGPELEPANFPNVLPCPPLLKACTVGKASVDGGTLPAPVDGLIVSWSIYKAQPKPGYTLRILNRSGANLTGVATSAPATPAGYGIETFVTAMPIKAGQIIGLTIPSGLEVGSNNDPDATNVFLATALPDGTTEAGAEAEGEEAFDAVLLPAPSIAAISPASGPPTGGTRVAIAGSDLEGAEEVEFGGVPAESYSVESESEIAAVAPPGTGAVPITVTTVAGTGVSPQAFAYETQAAEVAPPAQQPPPTPPTCVVPGLKGKGLKTAKKLVRAAGCALGKLIRKGGASAKTGRVAKQSPQPGTTIPAGTGVRVTLAP